MPRSRENKILVVDDDPSILGVLEDLLENEGYKVILAQTGEEGLEIIRKGKIQIALVDIRLDKMDGLELMEQIQREKLQSEVIFMTSYASIETVIEALRMGAFDYLIKPFENLNQVVELIDRTMKKVKLKEENSRLVAELLLKNAELEKINVKIKNMAVRDGLTGLYNYRLFKEALEKEISRSSRYKYNLCLLMMDLDHFKKYNDQYGHVKGDTLLKEVSRVLLDGSRPSDVTARYGGEEFVMILPETTKKMGIKVAERFRKEIGKLRHPEISKGPSSGITISIGVAEFPSDAEAPLELIKIADAALYGAKFNGRNRIQVSPNKKADISDRKLNGQK